MALKWTFSKLQQGVFLWSGYGCLLVLALGALQVGAEEHGEGDSELGNPQTVILRTSTVGEDLLIDVYWSPQFSAVSVEVAVADESGVIVDSIPVAPALGEDMQVVLPSFLSRVPADGFQFLVVLRIPEGEEVIAEHAFRVFFDCPSNGEGCVWETADGLESTSLTIREPMLEGLDAAEASGSIDLLTDLLADRPELTGQITSLASQLDRLDDRLNLGQDCFCSWLAAFIEEPSKLIVREDGSPVDREWQYKEQVGKGLRLLLGGQAHSMLQPIQFEVAAESRVTLLMRCWRLAGWIGHEVSMSEGIAPRTIRFPQVVPCLDTCSAQITFSSESNFMTEIAGLQAVEGQVVSASSTVEGALMIIDKADDRGITDSWTSNRYCEGPQCTLRADRKRTTRDLATAARETMRNTGVFSSRAQIFVNTPERGQWGLSCSGLSTRARAVGTSDCAIDGGTSFVLDPGVTDPRGGTCGELEINPWEP